MKRELFLQIAEIENVNDVSNVTTNIVNALKNNQITSEDAKYLLDVLTLTLKSLGFFK